MPDGRINDGLTLAGDGDRAPGTAGPTAGATDSQLANIQVLRCLAAMAVVWHHAETRLSSDLGAPWLGFTGIVGVDVFFVISGFIMFHTTRDGTRTTAVFWKDRLIRVAPLYWIGTFLVVALYLVGANFNGVKKLSVDDVVTSLAFFPDVRADGVPYTVLDVGWTLIFEIYFYLLFGLTFFLRSQAKALTVLTTFFLACAAVRMMVKDLPFAIEYYFRPITLEFAAGGALALLYRSARLAAIPAITLRRVGAVLALSGAAMILVAGWKVGWRLNTNFELRVLVFGVPSAVLVAGMLLLERGGFVMRNRLLLLLGAASYAIYLVHQFVIGVLEEIARRAVGVLTLDVDLAFICAGLVLAALVGVAVHLWVEKPMTAWLKARFRRPRAAS